MGQHDVSRRRFLATAAAAAGATAWPWHEARGGPTDPWGHVDPGLWPACSPTPCATAPAYKVLEIHLYGGLSPWETFYFRDLPANRGWRDFEFTSFTPPGGGTAQPLDAFVNLSFNGLCTGAPTSADTPQLFDGSDSSHRVFLGPVTKPLWASSIFDRTRVIVLQHDLLPHEAAIPYAITGFRLGNPKLAGLGAAIQRRALAIEETKPPAMRRTIPFSYVLRPADFYFPDNLLAISATGQHPGSARPVVITSDETANLLSLLDRSSRIQPSADQLFNYYRGQYRDWMRYAGMGDPTRSRGFADFDAAAASLLVSASLRTLMSSAPLALRTDPGCANHGSASFGPYLNVPGTALRIAAHLLADPATPAHYVGVVDSGLITVGGAAYDTHDVQQVQATALNLLNVLSTLRELVDAGTLNLDTTMVVLTTEFGRTPYRSSTGSRNLQSNGRDHWPQGFVNVLIGGPITSSGRKLVGRIQDPTAPGDTTVNGIALPSAVYNCSDVRAAVLLAAGVFPFAEGLFGTTDISASLIDPTSHDETTRNIRRTLLGVAG